MRDYFKQWTSRPKNPELVKQIDISQLVGRTGMEDLAMGMAIATLSTSKCTALDAALKEQLHALVLNVIIERQLENREYNCGAAVMDGIFESFINEPMNDMFLNINEAAAVFLGGDAVYAFGLNAYLSVLDNFGYTIIPQLIALSQKAKS